MVKWEGKWNHKCIYPYVAKWSHLNGCFVIRFYGVNSSSKGEGKI